MVVAGHGCRRWWGVGGRQGHHCRLTTLVVGWWSWVTLSAGWDEAGGVVVVAV